MLSQQDFFLPFVKIAQLFSSLDFHSVEKDGSPLSDEKQTIQTSLFSLLKDFLKSPTQEELHSVLCYILAVGEEVQVGLC